MNINWKVLLVFIMSSSVFGQNIDSLKTSGIKPKIFIDGYHSDFDFIRREVNFVDYVRDRLQADIYLLVTHQATGTGHKYTLTFFGQKSFLNINDTLNYHSTDFDSDEQRRSLFINTLKRGLIRYINKTDLADKIEITYKGGENENGEVWNDPWDHWVFRLRLSGNFNGEKYQSSYNIYSSARISRITEDWKIRLDMNANFYQDRYVDEEENLVSNASSKYFGSIVIKSINDHFSAGFYGFASASTYANTRILLSVLPGIEYNIFPYSESTYQEFRFNYGLGFYYYKYIDITIFDKLHEMAPKQQLQSEFEIKRPWGEIDLRLTFITQLDNFSRNRIELWGGISFYVFEGFSFDLNGGYSGIRDQINIPQRDLTIDEILLRRRQLETNYYYWSSIGFSYTFGSIYDNIVNTRFGI